MIGRCSANPFSTSKAAIEVNSGESFYSFIAYREKVTIDKLKKK